MFKTIETRIRNWPAGSRPLMLIVTTLAGDIVVTCLMLFSLVWFLLTKNPLFLKYSGLIIVSVFFVNFFKHWFKHSRPETEFTKARYKSFSKYSFPSGHSGNGGSTYLGLALLVAKLGCIDLIISLLLAIILVLLVGLSRIYLGAHYVKDVLFGWSISIVLVISFSFII